MAFQSNNDVTVFLTLGSAVNSPVGTFTVAYPSGLAQADFTGNNASATASMVVNNNDVYFEADDDFDITYGSSNITVTNKTGSTLAAGSEILLGLARANPTSEFTQADPVGNLGGTLTGDTTGTMADVEDVALDTSDTYTDAAVNAAVNAAVAEINLQLKELQVKLNATLTSLRTAGIIAAS